MNKKTKKTLKKCVSVLMTIALIVGSASLANLSNAVAATTSTIVDSTGVGGFESGSVSNTASNASATTWYYSGSSVSVATSTTSYSAGSKSLKVAGSNRNSSGSAYVQLKLSNLAAGEYTMSFKYTAYGTSTSTTPAIRGYAYSSASSSSGYSAFTSNSATPSTNYSYSTYTATFTLDSAQSSYYVGFYASNVKSTVYLYVDEFSLTYTPSANYVFSSVDEEQFNTLISVDDTSLSSTTLPSSAEIVTVNEDDATDTDTATVPVTWTDTSSVNFGTEGVYAIYGYVTYGDTNYDVTGKVKITSQTTADSSTGTDLFGGYGSVLAVSSNAPTGFTGSVSNSSLTVKSTSNEYVSTDSNSYALSLYNGSSSTATYTLYYSTALALTAGQTYTLKLYCQYTGSEPSVYPYINGNADTTTAYSGVGSWDGTFGDGDDTYLIEMNFTATSSSSGYYGIYISMPASTWMAIDMIQLIQPGQSLYDDGDWELSNDTTNWYAASYTALSSASVKLDSSTTELKAALPETASVLLKDADGVKSDRTVTANISWDDISGVNLKTEGTYTAFGTATYNVYSIAVEATVEVYEVQGNPSDGSGTSGFEGVLYKDVWVNGGDLIKGCDISTVIALENSGVTYYDTDGNAGDLFQILKDAGVNYIRVRIWNDPYRASCTTEASKTPDNSYGGGVCDVNYAVKIAERCAKVGIKLYASFHYSDWWSDPSRSIVPKAWSGYTVSQKADAIYDFTTETLEKIEATGVDIGLVSVGNETTNYMCGESSVSNIATLMKSGCQAVRDFDPNILIALHYTNPETWNFVTAFASTLDSKGVDYDVFSTSYYPFWHGTLANLKTKLDAVAEKYDKLTMITEFSHPYTTSDLDGSNNTMSSSDMTTYITSTFGAASESGQYSAVKTMYDYAATIENCVGVFYWEPAWLGVSSTYWTSQGAGWTTKYSSEYDSSNGSSSAGGSGCENQAFFDSNGKPLSVLTNEVFDTVWSDGYEPIIDVAYAQTSNNTVTFTNSSGEQKTGFYLRFIGEIDGKNYSQAGFKIEVYDEDGNILSTISKKTTSTLYSNIKANGETLTADGFYYYAYTFKNVPSDTTYYFKVIPYANSFIGSDNNANTYQKAYKLYKVKDRQLTVVSEIPSN